ncbi:MAG: 30S ribosomal protein S2 [Candidatus Aenigmarchaeota archaeon]|nr:30S ribosomal protein S2 [Candidatus Aenigmarchaeota archaeon]
MPFEEYLSAGMHIGMKQQNKNMKRFIYKIRDDGLAILDLQTIENRIKLVAKFLAKFKRIIVVSRKSVAWKPITKFAEAIDGKALTGRFLPGTITNPNFPGYFEPEVLLVTDPLIDSQAIEEALKMRIPIVALCDTSNETSSVDLLIPVNNKGRKSISMVYWLLAREIQKNRGIIKEDEEFKYKPEDFEPKERKRKE